MGTIAYAVKLKDPEAHKQALAVAHGVLVTAEQIGSAHSTMARYLADSRGPGDKSVIWLQFFAAAAAVGELRARLTRHKSCEVAGRNYLEKIKPALVPLLDRIVARQVRGDVALQMCCYAQTHFWSHWHEGVSTDFIESLGFDGKDPAVILTTDEGSSTGSPWVKEAWRRAWMREFKLKERQLQRLMGEIKELCRDSAKMGRYAALGILISTGAKLEKYESNSQDVIQEGDAPVVVRHGSVDRIRLTA